MTRLTPNFSKMIENFDDILNAPISLLIIISIIFIKFLQQFQIFTYYDLYFNFHHIKNHGEYWRLFTSVFNASEQGANFLVFIGRFSLYALSIESHKFCGHPADFLLFLLVGFATSWISALIDVTVAPSRIFFLFIFYYYLQNPVDEFFKMVKRFISPLWIAIYKSLLFTYTGGFSVNSMSDVIACIPTYIFYLIHDIVNPRYNMKLLIFPASFNEMLFGMLKI